jgi:putative transposase
MKTVAEVIGVSRSNLIERERERAKKRIGRPPLPDDNLVAEIKAVIAELPTYGYCPPARRARRGRCSPC